jgi:oxalate decarboxylase
LIKLAMATGAGLAMGVGAASGESQSPPASQKPAAPSPGSSRFKFQLGKLQPAVDTKGGSVAECDKRHFPVLQDGEAAIFLLKLAPGGLREPHWHPNCWELDHVVSGKVEMTIVSPDGPVETFTLEAGDVAFVPQGYAHSILNIGDGEAVIPIVFNNSLPSDIGLSTMYAEFPAGQFPQTFGVGESKMVDVPRPQKTLFIVPKSPTP